MRCAFIRVSSPNSTEIELLGQHGTMLPPEMVGLTEEQVCGVDITCVFSVCVCVCVCACVCVCVCARAWGGTISYFLTHISIEREDISLIKTKRQCNVYSSWKPGLQFTFSISCYCTSLYYAVYN